MTNKNSGISIGLAKRRLPRSHVVEVEAAPKAIYVRGGRVRSKATHADLTIIGA